LNAPTLASLVLRCVQSSREPLTTSDIYQLVDSAENIAQISGCCRDLVESGRLQREQRHSRWFYTATQGDLIAAAEPEIEPREQRPRTTLGPGAPERVTGRAVAHPVRTRRAGVSREIKLRTLERLAEIVATDIADVLRAIGDDLRRAS
jgi:hypothetical protein